MESPDLQEGQEFQDDLDVVDHEVILEPLDV
jgi:hypothetical protein